MITRGNTIVKLRRPMAPWHHVRKVLRELRGEAQLGQLGSEVGKRKVVGRLRAENRMLSESGRWLGSKF